MAQGKGLSKEEIAKQFMLPERKSKIATLLKQDGAAATSGGGGASGGGSLYGADAALISGTGQLYCVCRSSDSSRFMIACDACEIWYHGDCIGISQQDAKYIKHYYCDFCQSDDRSLRTKFRAPKRVVTSTSNDGSLIRKRDSGNKEAKYSTAGNTKSRYKARRKYRDCDVKKSSSSSSPLPPPPLSQPTRKKKRDKAPCGQCENCIRREDCGKCGFCRKTKRAKDHAVVREKCVYKQCLNFSKSNRRKRKDSFSAEYDSSKRTFDNSIARQCYGPECTNQARPDSKYCCEDCGLKLAYARIYHILPARIQERNLSICYAELKNERDLVDIRKKQLEVRDVLKALDRRHKELDAILEYVKQLTVVNDEDDEQEDETEVDMYCITCGHQIHTRTAIKHMEKCFNKYESQSSFCSVQKTRIDGNNMFCDFFNPSNQTYCKRLRVLCPEHYKDAKIADDEVCGFPLVTNVFVPTGEYCRISKKSCVRHYSWEKLRRAEIDMERVRQWLKLDELVEQEHQKRNFMRARTGVLNLMLHSTYNHDIMNTLAVQSQSQPQPQPQP